MSGAPRCLPLRALECGPPGSCGAPRDWNVYRRLRAWDLAQQGWKQCQIARALGVTAGAVSQWLEPRTDRGLRGVAAPSTAGTAP